MEESQGVSVTLHEASGTGKLPVQWRFRGFQRSHDYVREFLGKTGDLGRLWRFQGVSWSIRSVSEVLLEASRGFQWV